MDTLLAPASAQLLTLVLDLIGTFAFAISGGVAGVRHRLDVFGILVLSVAAATAGGIVRDVLIGSVPPAAIGDWRYLAVALLAGLITFFWHPAVDRMRNLVLLFDSAGLGVFAVAGTVKALAFDLSPMAAVLLGVLTGVGGGMARDILVARIPTVLHAELYAVAALAGSTVVIIGDVMGVPSGVVAPAGAVLCFGLRVGAIRKGWKLPLADDYSRNENSEL